VRAMRNEPPPAQSETFFPRNLHCDTMHSCPCLLGTTTFGRDMKRSHIALNGRIFKGYVRSFYSSGDPNEKKKTKEQKGTETFGPPLTITFPILLSTIFEDGLGSQVEVLVISLELLVQSYLG